MLLPPTTTVPTQYDECMCKQTCTALALRCQFARIFLLHHQLLNSVFIGVIMSQNLNKFNKLHQNRQKNTNAIMHEFHIRSEMLIHLITELGRCLIYARIVPCVLLSC